MAIRGFGGNQYDVPDVPWQAIARRVPFIVLAVVAILVLWNSFYTLNPHENAVVLRFGKYQETTTPGLHFMVPLVDKPVKVGTNYQNMRLPVPRELDDRSVKSQRGSGQQEEEALELTGDLNATVVEWTVQWRVIDPRRFLFSIAHDHVELVIEMAAKSVMHRLVGDYSVDEILTAKREEVGLAALKATQAMLDLYDSGVSITNLQMQRVTPPDQVKPAFDEVNKAIQDRDKLVNEANRERNQLIPRAKANADKLVRESEGYADRRRAEAQGEISALLAKYRAYQEAPDITRQRLYLEAMEDVLSGSGPKTVLDGDLRGLVPLLHVAPEVVTPRTKEGR